MHRVIDRLVDIAGGQEAIVEIENEPICNVGSIAELVSLFGDLSEPIVAGLERPNVNPLIDIANSYAMGAPPSDADIAALAPMVDAIHLKDINLASKRFVPFGEGDIRAVGLHTRTTW